MLVMMYQNKRAEMVVLCRDSNERRSERPTIIIWFTNTTAILLNAHTRYEMHLLQGGKIMKLEFWVHPYNFYKLIC